MICQRLSHHLMLFGLIFILGGCSALSTPIPSTATTIPATATPGPPTSTPEYRLKFVMKGNDLTYEDGWPVGATTHTENGKTPPGVMSQVYTSTFVDVSELHGKKESLHLIYQVNDRMEDTHSVAVNIQNLDSFYVDENNIVFPFGVNGVENGGPFIKLMIRLGNYDDGKLLDQTWEITAQQGKRTYKDKVSEGGTISFSDVTAEPIEISLTNTSTSKKYHYTVFVTFRGAVEDLITYEIGIQ